MWIATIQYSRCFKWTDIQASGCVLYSRIVYIDIQHCLFYSRQSFSSESKVNGSRESIQENYEYYTELNNVNQNYSG